MKAGFEPGSAPSGHLVSEAIDGFPSAARAASRRTASPAGAVPASEMPPSRRTLACAPGENDTAFTDLAPEIVDAIAARLRRTDVAALARVNRATCATLERRVLQLKWVHCLGKATTLNELRTVLREAQDSPSWMQAGVLAASARRIERLDASEREAAFRQVLQAGMRLPAQALAHRAELSLQIQALPAEAQAGAIRDLFAATRGNLAPEACAVLTGLYGWSRPVFRASLHSALLFENPTAFSALLEQLGTMAPSCRALPLVGLASELHAQEYRLEAFRGVLASLYLVPRRERVVPMLGLADQFFRVPLRHRVAVAHSLCGATAALPEEDRAEVVALLTSQLSALEGAARASAFDMLLRVVQGICPLQRSVLLAELAAIAELEQAEAAGSILRRALAACAGLPLPERRTPLTVMLHQSQALGPDERAALQGECRAIWERPAESRDPQGLDDAAESTDLAHWMRPLASVGPAILDDVRRALHVGCPGWLAGLLIQALHDFGNLDAAVALPLLLEASRCLPPPAVALVAPKLLEQFTRLSAPGRQALLPPLFDCVARMPERDRYATLEKLTWALWGLPAGARLAVFRRLMAFTRELDISRQAGILLNFHFVLDVLDADERQTAFIELIEVARTIAVEHRSLVLAQFAVSAESLAGPGRLAAFMAILDAIGSIPQGQGVIAVVRRYGRWLPPAEGSALEERCDALSTWIV